MESRVEQSRVEWSGVKWKNDKRRPTDRPTDPYFVLRNENVAATKQLLPERSTTTHYCCWRTCSEHSKGSCRTYCHHFQFLVDEGMKKARGLDWTGLVVTN